ncbi:MAG TPA: nucleotide disphospho-sugar-binding domain-containing protein [Caulobacteraceae bacterium]|nr:nucleotide disphospho-sugar-binding domain-containing protein [Caulobacteraceae bacterium]
MRILISCVGTRGDVQPALALALALRGLSQDVRLCVPPNFVGRASDLGFAARPIGIEMRAPRPGEAPQPIPDLIKDQFDVVTAAAEGCDLIVGAGAHQYAVRSAAEVRGVPSAVAVYAPTSIPDGSAQWAHARAGWNQRSLERVNENRQRLGLSAISDVVDHILGERPWLAADALLGPAPATSLDIVQTGAWVMADERALPPQLEAFLDAGDPPVYLGLGSMPAAPEAARNLIRAARAVGRRAVLSRGWAELALIDQEKDGIAIGDVSHQSLFPRVAAVVHHAGAGTTTAAALAATPQVACPMFGDQPYWASRIETLGLGAVAAPQTTAALAEALGKALNPTVAAHCAALAPKVSATGALTAAQRLVGEFG